MPRAGSTYGPKHQAARKRALAAFRDGQLCARCASVGISHPLAAGEPVELDHGPDGRYLGLSAKRCNRSHGGRLGRAAQTGLPSPPATLLCVVCGLAFQPKNRGTVTCGKPPCVTVLKRRRRAGLADGTPPTQTGRAW